jgi:hypothetical protein
MFFEVIVLVGQCNTKRFRRNDLVTRTLNAFAAADAVSPGAA